MEEKNLDNFDDFVSDNYIKGTDLKSDKVTVVVTDIEAITQKNNKNQLVVSFEYDKKDWKFGLNATNTKKVTEFVKAPKELLGKKLHLKKVLATNPDTKKEVESIRIEKVE